jgi:succinoglycan biosynthesis transport protein ExoP
MNLHQYLTILGRQKWLIGATMAIAVVVTVIGSRLIPPVYEATALVRITTPARGNLGDVYYDLDYADRLMNTYIAIGSSRPIRAELMTHYGLTELPELTVSILANTELLALTAKADKAQLASELANALATRLITWGEASLTAETQNRQLALQQQLSDAERELNAVQAEYDALLAQNTPNSGLLSAIAQELEQKRSSYAHLLNQYEILRLRPVLQANLLTIVEPAVTPEQPSSPNVMLLVALAAILGLAGGLGIAFMRENLDNRLHTVQQIEEVTGLPTLALVNEAEPAQWPDAKLNPHSWPTDSYSRLAANLASRASEGNGLLVLVTSAESGEGKSPLVANLGAAIAKLGYGVLAVDCNFYHPSLHTLLQTGNKRGVIDLLRQRSQLDQTAQRTRQAQLRVIPTGQHVGHSAELFTLARITEFANQLRATGQIVLLDAPALLTSFEATLLATIADGILFVVGQSIAHETAVQQAQSMLTPMSEKLFGVVITQSATSSNAIQQKYPVPAQQATQPGQS